MPHLDRAPVVSRASRLLRVVRPRRPAEQLALDLRRAGLVARPARPRLVPALLLSRAARPGLAQPRGRRGVRRRAALLAGPRRRRLPPRRARPAAQGPSSCRDDPPARRALAGGAAGGRRGVRAARARPLAQRARHRRPRSRSCARRSGDAFLVGEVYLRSEDLAPYLERPRHRLLLRALPRAVDGERGARRAAGLRGARRRPRSPGCSPTTTSRGCRSGSAPATCAPPRSCCSACPGAAFVFQGDEIGMADGPGASDPTRARRPRRPRRPPPPDGVGRQPDTAASPPARRGCRSSDPAAANVADQERDPGSLLHLYRDLIALRRDTLRGPLKLLDVDATAPGVLAFTRGGDARRRAQPRRRARRRRRRSPATVAAPHARSRPQRGATRQPLAPGEGFIADHRLTHRLLASHRSCPPLHGQCGRVLPPSPWRVGSSRSWRLPQRSLRWPPAEEATTSRGGSTLNWFIFNEPSGAVQAAAEQCSKASERRLQDQVQYLPARRRRAARAARPAPRRRGRLDRPDRPWTSSGPASSPTPAGSSRCRPRSAAAVTKDVFPSVLNTARFEGRLYAAPIRSNTQLLWYRKDRVKEAPEDLGRR